LAAGTAIHLTPFPLPAFPSAAWASDDTIRRQQKRWCLALIALSFFMAACLVDPIVVDPDSHPAIQKPAVSPPAGLDQCMWA